MHFAGKSGIATHLMYLLIVSAIMAVLLTFVIDSLYVPDPQQCSLIKYKIESQCKTDEGLEIGIKNTGDLSFSVIFGKDLSTAQRLTSGSSKTIEYRTQKQSVQTNFAVTSTGGEHICRAGEIKTEMNLIKRC